MNLSYTYKVKTPQYLMAWWMGEGRRAPVGCGYSLCVTCPLELHRRSEDALAL